MSIAFLIHPMFSIDFHCFFHVVRDFRVQSLVEASWKALESILEVSWELLEASWSRLGASLELLEASWELLEAS